MAYRPAGFSDSDASDGEDDGGWDTGDFGKNLQRSNRRMGGGGNGARGGRCTDATLVNNNVEDVKFEDAAQQKLLDRTKKYIRSCLISTKGFTEINDLEKEYRDVCETRIPFTQLGFSRLEDFLHSIPSVCRVRNMGFSVMVEGLADSATIHIKEMKMKEKNTGGGKKKRKGGAGGGGGYYSGGRSGYSRPRGGFSYGGRDDFDDGGFSIGGGGGCSSYGATSSSRNTISSSDIQPSRSAASTSSRNLSMYKSDVKSNQNSKSIKQEDNVNIRTYNCETEDKLKQTADIALVSDRLKDILKGRAFGLLMQQVSKKYEKEWQERLPDDIESLKMAGFCIQGKGTAPKTIKLIEDEVKEVKEATITTGANPKEIGGSFSEDELLVVEEVKKLLEKRVFGLPKSRVEVLVKKNCPVNLNSDFFDQMETQKLVKIEGQHKVVKWIAVA